MIRVLDFGAGDGEFGRLIELYMFGFRVESIDRKPRSFVVKCGDESSLLMFPKHEFDVVTCLSVVQSVEDERVLFDAFKGVLKDGGTLFLLYPRFWTFKGKTLWRYDRALNDTGFNIVKKTKLGGRLLGYVLIEAVACSNNAFY